MKNNSISIFIVFIVAILLFLKPDKLPAISKQNVAEAGKIALQGKPSRDNNNTNTKAENLRIVPPAFKELKPKTKIIENQKNSESMKNLSARYKKIIDDVSEKVLIEKPARVITNKYVNEPNPKVISDKIKQDIVMKNMLKSLGQISSYNNLSNNNNIKR